MERVLRDLRDLVDKLDEMVQNARDVPLTDHVHLDRSDLADIVEGMKAVLAELRGEPPQQPRYGTDAPSSGASIWSEPGKSIWDE